MNLNIYKTLILVTGLVFAACSSGDNGNGTGEQTEKTAVYLKIDTQKGLRSRADEPTATGTTALLYSAIVYFIDGEDDPRVYDVLTAGPGGDITIAELEEGYLVEDVNSQATQVYVIGNYNSVDQEGNGPTFPVAVGGRLSQVKSVVADIQQVSYPAITGVTLPDDNLKTMMDGQAMLHTYGTFPDDWNGDVTPGDDDKYANVEISPLVARIEIVEIAYEGAFSSFTLEGIYINNYFQRLPVSLDLTGYAPTLNGSNVNLYDVDNSAFAYSYYTTLYDTLDETAQIAGGEATFTPANGVWAYQVFGNSNPVPHIILKLTDVVSAGGVALEDQYLTITGFRAGGTDLAALERNTVYKINLLEFSDDDLDLLPEPETVNVWVHVEVEPWRTVNITPVL